MNGFDNLSRRAVLSVVMLGGVVPFAANSAHAAAGNSQTRTAAFRLGAEMGFAWASYQQGDSAKGDADAANAKELAGALAIEYATTKQDYLDTPPKWTDVIKGSALVSKDISEKYDSAHADLFEIALKCVFLARAYEPGFAPAGYMAIMVQHLCEHAALPSDIWDDTLKTIITSKKPRAEAVALIQSMNEKIDNYLQSG